MSTLERGGCREVLFEEGPGGDISVTGLCIAKAGNEQIVTADAYIAALDVPGQTTSPALLYRIEPIFATKASVLCQVRHFPLLCFTALNQIVVAKNVFRLCQVRYVL